MHTHPFQPQHIFPKRALASVAVLALLLISLGVVRAQGTPGSNTQPLTFGPGQTIIDLNKLVWVPLKAEGVPPGPEIAVLRGDGKADAGRETEEGHACEEFDRPFHWVPL